MTEYRLASAPMVHTPGIVSWAQNGYHFPADRPQLLAVLTSAFPTVPEEALHLLLSQQVSQRVEGETVVFDAYVQSPPVLETEAEFWEALECMPPSRWHHCNGVELFHICEHLTDNLVNWHAQYKGLYFQFNDAADANSTALAGRVRVAAR